MAATETSDLYGFPIKVDVIQKSERAAVEASANENVPAWQACIEKDKLPAEGKLKEMIRKGVPPTCRPWVWMNSSTAEKKKSSMASNYFQIMVAAGANGPCVPDIEKDLPHTYSTHPWISSPDGQASLKRVLSAYAAHNDKVGYCRSMNNIVGLLLVAMNRNEENTFWLLASLVEDILYPGTYAPKLEGCQVEMRALDELLLQKLPRLHAHLVAKECDISLFATDWYLGLYCNSLPAETTARVWDALFNEGPKILFRVALALLKLNEEILVHCDNAGDIVMAVRSAASSMHHHDRLMACAFDGLGSLSMATIDKFRELKAREVEARDGKPGVASPGSHQAEPASSSHKAATNEKLEVAKEKAKEGFGKFVSGVNKWADKAAEKMGVEKAW